jgi:hypothetical protein
MLKTLLLLHFFLCCGLVIAQTETNQNLSWKKHLSLADDLYEKLQYGEAATHYEAVWQLKKKRTEYANKAGECYMNVKDYSKAIEMFGVVKEDAKNYPKARFYYAKSLKQNEQYDSAIPEFKKFSDTYVGESAANFVAEALVEIEGCELAKQLKTNLDKGLRIIHLGDVINSSAVEFAPVAFGSEDMLFSSTKQGKAKVFQTQRTGTGWEVPALPTQFASLSEDNVCNTALSPDEKRMYFTVCRSIENWGALTTRCELYMTKRTGNLWGAPERLPDEINKTGVTSTQPTIFHEDGKEWIYFASNRSGGQGGMDIWYTSRDLDGAEMTFATPKNAGAKINTEKNEITPYYNPTEQVLYFSSDGHVGMGGLDIFKVQGKQSSWEKPVNIGVPINSGSDDYYYTQNRYGDGGFLVSNRTYSTAKVTTTHEDIFEFRMTQRAPMFQVTGIAYDKKTTMPIGSVDLSIYELISEQEERMLQTKVSTDGSFTFQVSPNKNYKIIAYKNGYQPGAKIFLAEGSGNFTADLMLEPVQASTEIAIPNVEVPKPVTPVPSTPTANTEKTAPKTTPVPKTKTEIPKATPTSNVEEYTYTPTAEGENFPIRTDAPKLNGVYYKVQLIALANFNRSNSRYDNIRKLGRLDYEFIMDKGITRVLLGDFLNKVEATDILTEVVKKGFEGAFIVKYENGERVGRSN